MFLVLRGTRPLLHFCRLSKDEHSPHSLIEIIHCSLQDEKGPNEILWFICEKNGTRENDGKKIVFENFVWNVRKLLCSENRPKWEFS